MKARSLLLAAAASLLVSQASCNAKFISTRFKGMVTPVSVSWDVAFMGQFDREKREDLKKLLDESDLPQDVKDEIRRVVSEDVKKKFENYESLVKSIVSPNLRERLDAIHAAGEFFFPPEMEDEKRVVVSILKSYLVASDNYKVRAHALVSLTKQGVPETEIAERLLFSKENIERFVAAYHLKNLGTSSSLPALERALSVERQPTVRNEIKKAIEAIESREAQQDKSSN